MLTIEAITALPGVTRNDSTQLEHWGAPSRVVAGRPDTRGLTAFSSAHGAFSAGVWECSPGKWRVHYTEDELSVLISGRMVVTDAAGAQRTFAAGDAFVVPAGFLGTF
ncbi:MAG: cupin domain-containing protein, partial [Alphaproteobacteria bacterium]